MADGGGDLRELAERAHEVDLRRREEHRERLLARSPWMGRYMGVEVSADVSAMVEVPNEAPEAEVDVLPVEPVAEVDPAPDHRRPKPGESVVDPTYKPEPRYGEYAEYRRRRRNLDRERFESAFYRPGNH
jgi:hypothetical protein